MTTNVLCNDLAGPGYDKFIEELGARLGVPPDQLKVVIGAVTPRNQGHINH